MNGWIVEIRGRISKYPGPGGWCFVSMGDEDSRKLKAEKRIGRTGFGYVPVTATLGSSTWRTTLFPTKEGPYMLAIKADVRAKERIGVGDDVCVRCAVALADPGLDDFL
jgi:hypothetical protein